MIIRAMKMMILIMNRVLILTRLQRFVECVMRGY